MPNRIHVELTEAQVRAVLVLCRMNEYQSLMIEALVGGTDLTEHKSTVALLKFDLTTALRMAEREAAQEHDRILRTVAEREKAATEVAKFPAAAPDPAADVPLA